MAFHCIQQSNQHGETRANQYDRKFKDWGVRKNLKSKEWRVIKYRVDKSKRAGKQCAVFVGGMLVPSEKLEKEIRRNDFPSAEERWGLGE
jgi:translation initiation factor 6 (eIF-6)